MLRTPRAADAAPYVRAFADDPGLARMLGFEAPSVTAMRKTFRGERRDRDEGRAVGFAMTRPGADEFLGSVLLHTFHWRHRRADCGVMVVPAARRGGLALEALRLAVRWAFDALGLQRVGLATLPENVATQRLAERAGFRREGVLRAYTREFGRPADNVMFGAVHGDPAWA